jgi:hypothetical protein
LKCVLCALTLTATALPEQAVGAAYPGFAQFIALLWPKAQ